LKSQGIYNTNGFSEFPSLSGAPQPQFSNPSQAIWANASQRAVQHTPVQRPQQQNSINPQAVTQLPLQQNQQAQETPQSTGDDLFSPTSRFSSGIDEYRHGGQGGMGQLSGSAQPQTGNIDEFPPLSRNGNDDAGHDPRGSLMQNAAFGGFSNANSFVSPPNQVQTRHGITNTPSSHTDTGRSAALAERNFSPNDLGFGGA
jgi:CCR4-NOT transcription complex subunit 2